MYFLPFRIFEQLALALKTEFALKFFKPGVGSPHRAHVFFYGPFLDHFYLTVNIL